MNLVRKLQHIVGSEYRKLSRLRKSANLIWYTSTQVRRFAELMCEPPTFGKMSPPVRFNWHLR
jgi:hypothetical protein